MSYPSSNHTPEPNPSPSTGFNAQSQMGLAEVLQMCCLGHRSGQITFRSEESYGFVFIQHGRVLHAMCGVVEGEEAIYLMLSWPGGGFTVDEGILPHKKTISMTWEQLLFEGARRADVGLVGPGSLGGGPVTTADPMTSTRHQESQPKLTITRPDLPPIVHNLDQEYTHVGRAAGNEIPLPYPSVSSRHCILVLSGPDIVLRDLNSSNGTFVNGESITETILRPGDEILVGAVKMKFEPGMKRPKLQGTVPTPQPTTAPVEIKKKTTAERAMTNSTVKLPTATIPRLEPKAAAPVTDDNAYVKGQTAISYANLPKPAEVKKGSPLAMIAIGIVLLIALSGVTYYYFFVLHGSH